jgi:hypothetical protein
MDELKFPANQVYYNKWAILFKTEILSSILRIFKNKPPGLNQPKSKKNRFRWKAMAVIKTFLLLPYSPELEIANFGLDRPA